jgi:hypothetical protein
VRAVLGEEGAVDECGGEAERRGKARRRRRGAGKAAPGMETPAAARARRGGGRLEVGEAPDVWAPHVSG